MTRGRLLLASEPQPARIPRTLPKPRPEHVAHEDGERPLAVCLFAGPGGETEGEVLASEEAGLVMGLDYDYIAINHDEHCVETLRTNHPKAEILHDDIEKLDPRKVLLNPKTGKLRRVTRLTGSPQCQGYSRAAGGKPRSRQLRASVFYILKWIRWGRPRWGCFENVPEFLRTREFRRLLRGIEALRKVGLHYRIERRVIDAADLGGAQNRKRAFIQIALDYAPITWPKQTHSDPRNPVPGTQPWRCALDILDLDAPTKSVYGRDKPLVVNTLARYARGMRDEWGSFWGEPLAETFDAYIDAWRSAWWPALARGINNGMDTWEADRAARKTADAAAARAPGWGPVPLRHFLERAPPEQWPRQFPVRVQTQEGETRLALATLAPLTMGQNGGAEARSAREPLATLQTAGFTRILLPELFILPAQGRFANGGKSNPPRSARLPLNTQVAGKDSSYVAQLELRPFLIPRHSERDGQQPRFHQTDRPVPTIACSAEPALAQAFLVVMYNGNGQVLPASRPLPTETCVERHAIGGILLEVSVDDVLVHPTLRPLLVREGMRGQGFPERYVITGPRRAQWRQIGDAVHVAVSRALYRCGLTGTGIRDTRLTDFEEASTA